MSKITYTDKNTGDTFLATEANEIKTVVNNNESEADNNFNTRPASKQLVDKDITTFYDDDAGIYDATSTYSNKGIGSYILAKKTVQFNKLSIKQFTELGGIYNVYISSIEPATGLNPSNLTLVGTHTVTSDDDLDSDFFIINFDDVIEIESGNYLVILTAMDDGINNSTLNRWLTEPGKDNIILTSETSDVFNNTWTVAAASLSVPPVLEIITYNDTLNSKILAKTDKLTYANGSEHYGINEGADYKAYSFESYYGTGCQFIAQKSGYINKLTLFMYCSVDVNLKIYKSQSVIDFTSGNIDLDDGSFTLLSNSVQSLNEANDTNKPSVIILDTPIEIIEGNNLLILTDAVGDSTRVDVARRNVDEDTGAYLYNLSATTEDSSWVVSSSYIYSQIPPIVELVANSLYNLDFQLHSEIIAMVGVEFNIYLNTLERSGKYKCEITTTGIGKLYNDRFSVTPLLTDVGEHVLTFTYYDGSDIIAIYRRYLTIIEAPTLSGENILLIGDSILANIGGIQDALTENLALVSGTALNFVGSITTSGVNHEGRSGWTYNDFCTGDRTPYYKFNVTGISVSPSLSATYTHNGSTYSVREINIVDGDGYLNCQRSSGAVDPLTSGTLTKVTGSGDATITFATWETETANPFWNVDQLDISNYRSGLGLSGYINTVVIMLGANEAISDDDTLTLIPSNVKNLIDAFIADNSSTKIILMYPTLTGDNDAFAGNYTCEISYEETRERLFQISELLNDNFDNELYNNNTSLGNCRSSLNPIYGYTTTETNPASRYTDIGIEIQANALHPSQEGGEEIGDNWTGYILNSL